MTCGRRAGIPPDALQIDSQSCRPEMPGDSFGTGPSTFPSRDCFLSGPAGSAPTTSNSFPPKICWTLSSIRQVDDSLGFCSASEASVCTTYREAITGSDHAAHLKGNISWQFMRKRGDRGRLYPSITFPMLVHILVLCWGLEEANWYRL